MVGLGYTSKIKEINMIKKYILDSFLFGMTVPTPNSTAMIQARHVCYD
jgi:hypothetical protein